MIKPVGNYVVISDLKEFYRTVIEAVVKEVPENMKPGVLSAGDMIILRNRDRIFIRHESFVDVKKILFKRSQE